MTGGSSGIGLEVVRVLALAGAKVVVGCPKLDKGHAAVESIRPVLLQASPVLLLLKIMPLQALLSLWCYAPVGQTQATTPISPS